MNHHYETSFENVSLRPLEETDIENLRKWRNDPKNSVYLSKLPYITTQMQKEWFNQYLNNNDEINLAIVENRELNRLVGSLSLYSFSDESCYFGKILVGDDDAHGRKIGLNATMAAVRLAFEKLKMKEVKLFVYTENVGALRIYSQAGFRIIDEHESKHGKKEYTMIITRGG